MKSGFSIFYSIAICCIATINSQAELSPSDVAINFVKNIALDQVDIAKDTALSVESIEKRKTDLINRLSALTALHVDRSYEFTVEAKKVEEPLAAVLIRSQNEALPLDQHISPIALIKKNGQWLPAPSLGSYSNTNYGYNANTEQTVKNLEVWMKEQKYILEAHHKEKQSRLFQQELTQLELDLQPKKLDATESFYQFIKHLKNKDLKKLLVSLGASQALLQEPLEHTIENINLGLKNTEPVSSWFRLSNKHHISQVLEDDQKNNQLVIGIYDIDNPNQSRIEIFPYIAHKENYYIRLSNELAYARLDHHRRLNSPMKYQRKRSYIKKILPTILTRFPSLEISTPEKAIQQFNEALKETEFSHLISFIPREGNFFSDIENQKQVIRNLHNEWLKYQAIKVKSVTPLPIFKEDNLALISLQRVNTYQNKTSDTIYFWAIKNNINWHIIDNKSLSLLEESNLQKTAKNLLKQSAAYQKANQKKTQEALFNDISYFSLPLTTPIITEKAAEKTIRLFRSSLRDVDYKKVISHSAISAPLNSEVLLKKLHYATRGAQNHKTTDHILGFPSSDKWRAVSLRTESISSGSTDYPLYIMVETLQGTKVILDIDLRYETNKGRKILNEETWEKIKTNFPKGSFEHLQNLMKQHQELVKKDLIKLEEEAK